MRKSKHFFSFLKNSKEVAGSSAYADMGMTFIVSRLHSSAFFFPFHFHLIGAVAEGFIDVCNFLLFSSFKK